MPEDLTTAEPETTDEIEDVVFEPTTREAYISSCYFALSAVDGFNPMIKEDEARVKRIQRKCLRILDNLVGEMYDELLEDTE